ncbi:MAG: hypothetical protein U1B83_06940, partial [Candidatus Cloacimonadaceae bacterium]|nr:hypothetical protein [Candidatus Cloacimonadaceae bacterium]
MKKLLLLVTFAALTLGIFAQTGIWGLAFNQSIDDARNIMKTRGFKLMEETSLMLTYSNASIPNLENVRLKLNDTGDKLRSWMINYKANNDPALEKSIFAELNKIHGDISYFDDYWE